MSIVLPFAEKLSVGKVMQWEGDMLFPKSLPKCNRRITSYKYFLEYAKRNLIIPTSMAEGIIFDNI
jgi:hypothetical protein